MLCRQPQLLLGSGGNVVRGVTRPRVTLRRRAIIPMRVLVMDDQPPPTTDKQAKCSAMRRDGSPCRAPALPGKGLCWSHEPELNERRDEARRAGGANRANAVRVRKIGPPGIVALLGTLEQALADVLSGALDPRAASAAASLARALVAAHAAGEVEVRLADIERQLHDREDTPHAAP